MVLHRAFPRSRGSLNSPVVQVNENPCTIRPTSFSSFCASAVNPIFHFVSACKKQTLLAVEYFMNPLDSYLVRVARELRSMPPSKRDDELRELRSHLEQRAEDFARDGLSPEAAQAQALHEFGSPRSLGSNLCDAWEDMPFSLWRLLTTLVPISIIWLVASIVLHVGLFVLAFWDQAALLPELPSLVALVFVSLPFACGWLFSRGLGRRGPLVTLLYFGGLAILNFQFHLPFGVEQAFSLPKPLFNLFMAFCGAIYRHDLYRQRLRFAFIGGKTLASPVSSRPHWRSGGFVSLVILFLIAVFSYRVHAVLHPTTPIGILRASLLTNRGMNSFDFVPPRILEMVELSPTTSAERAGREERIFFKLEASAAPEYAARRVAFLKHELASPQQRKSWGEQSLRNSLKRLQLNRQIVRGTARLIQTPSGWKIDENSFDRSQLWAWCYDISYDTDS